MNLTFLNPGIDYMIKSIMAFQGDNEKAAWADTGF